MELEQWRLRSCIVFMFFLFSKIKASTGQFTSRAQGSRATIVNGSLERTQQKVGNTHKYSAVRQDEDLGILNMFIQRQNYYF